MKKILVMVSSPQVHPGSLDFACFIARLTHSPLTGVFLKEETFEPVPSPNDRSYSFQEPSGAVLPHQATVNSSINQGIHFFLEACMKRGVRADILIRGRMDSNPVSPVEEAINESRFADLLIMDPEIPLYDTEESTPAHLLKEVLTGSECPVIIAPNIFSGIDEIVFCYDGEQSSVFAMKQFTYLFPQLTDIKVTVLKVVDHKKTIAFREKVKGWLSCSYSNIDFHEPQGDVPGELFGYLLTKNNTFVVMGAFGRTLLSQSFKKSSADTIVRLIDLPLFIAHP